MSSSNYKEVLYIGGGNSEPPRQGPKPKSINWIAETPLYSAIRQSKPVEFIKTLLQNGADVNKQNENGDTPLHFALDHDEGKVLIEVLVQKGADVKIINNLGDTPLHSAIRRSKSVALIRALLQNGADTKTINIDADTPLHSAIRHHEKVELIGVLVEHGADVNAVNKFHNTPLQCAVCDNAVELIGVLVQNGANINKGNIDCDGDTPLHMAVFLDRPLKMIRELLEHGADINAVNEYHSTALHHAIAYDRKEEIIKELIELGTDVNIVDVNGDTPLHSALLHEEGVKIVKLLLHHGADISIVNKNGDTPTRCILRYIRSDADIFIGRYGSDVTCLECATLLTKTALMKNVDKHYKEIIADLSGYDNFQLWQLSYHLDGCIREIRHMKSDMINYKLSLYEIVNSANIKSLRINTAITDLAILTNYPIYYDVISPKIKWYLERASLLNKLSELEICSTADKFNEERKVILNFDSKFNVAIYLSNDDLFNLITPISNS